VQSFNDAHLKALGRVHDSGQAIAALEEAALAFDTFNLDLMYALPGQTWRSWSGRDAGAGADAAAPVDLPPDHRAQHLLRQVPAACPPTTLAYAMLDRITEMTGARGMERYEVSAYAKPGHSAGTTELLAVRRLPGHRRGRARQAQLRRTASCGRCASASPRSTWTTRWPATPSRRTRKSRARSCRSSSCSTRCGCGGLRAAGLLRAHRPAAVEPSSRRCAEAERKGLLERDRAARAPTERGFDFLSDLQGLFLAKQQEMGRKAAEVKAPTSNARWAAASARRRRAS
jgi:hypothetical protein